eukprot:TRINITY_DN54355_c0_g2_i1.p1 TRINITY_DN54355_c0_g2~~TRINITY_DN54355_c0_g2_i1.p1  ORF type:complete len:393 (+),score=58.55 TRINITY_DN54355_c0_g2_i1:1-1179(+)
MSHKAKKERIQKAEERRKAQGEEKKMMGNCTFKPSITQAAHAAYLSGGGGDNVYHRLTSIDVKKKEKSLQDLVDRVQAVQYEECTFRPNQATGPEAVHRKKEAKKVSSKELLGTCNRLYRDAELRDKRKKAQLEQAIEIEDRQIKASAMSANWHYAQREFYAQTGQMPPDVTTPRPQSRSRSRSQTSTPTHPPYGAHMGFAAASPGSSPWVRTPSRERHRAPTPQHYATGQFEIQNHTTEDHENAAMEIAGYEDASPSPIMPATETNMSSTPPNQQEVGVQTPDTSALLMDLVSTAAMFDAPTGPTSTVDPGATSTASPMSQPHEQVMITESPVATQPPPGHRDSGGSSSSESFTLGSSYSDISPLTSPNAAQQPAECADDEPQAPADYPEF